MSTTAPRDTVPPDGGWGWWIVLAAFLMNSLSYGIIRSVGVFFVEFVQFFDKSSGEVSWISSIAIAVQQFASPIGSAISSQYGERLVVMGGGILSCLGILLASFGNSLLHLYLGLGMLTGFGWALVFTPTMGMIPKYFTRRRVLALGLALTGNGISSFLFSPFFQVLIDNYSWRGALLILSAIVLNLCVCGALLRPTTLQGKVIKESAKSEDASRGQLCLRKISSIFDLSLFRNRGFVVYTIGLLFIGTGYFVPYVHLVPHGTDLGLSSYEAAFLMSVTALADAAMRLISGCFADLKLLSSAQLLFLWNTLTGLSLLMLPFGESYFSIMALGTFYGCSAGGFAPLIFAVVPDIVGVSRVTNAIGLCLMVMSFGGLLGPPLSGFLRDLTGNFQASFLLCATFILLGSCILLGLPSFFSCASSACLKKKTPDPLTPEEDPLSSSALISRSSTDHSLRSSQTTRLSTVLSDSSC
ncbi:monocarboxylate transporter 13-like [Microcaecilia unicolor]|uniref:Monocarboxylate transporter 13 n=1 Tax=Microcaecilia unicolor TaxID=1415580 RepID=A0A6P7WYE1_9AMPH|nr:monocarboxylate transporter 13-like [Microcaecilia unicolor]XP_030043305.1 monocarboxylate transporter 13-like [Microcaecilia unicolor]